MSLAAARSMALSHSSARPARCWASSAGMADVAAKLFDDTDDDASLPAASAIEGSGMGDSFKIDRRVVRFTRDPVIVCGPNRRFRLNVRRLRDRVVDLRYLSMHSSPGFPASLQTDAAAIAVATLAHDQPLKPGQLEGLPAQDRAVVARCAARLGMSITGGSLEQILQEANNETKLVLGSLEAGNNNPEVRAAAYRALCDGFQRGALGHTAFTQLVRRYRLP